MFDNDKMLGYCPLCMQNVEHTRKFSSWIMFLLDLLTLRLFRVFRFGPFYCYQCENKSLYLRPVRRSAPTYDSQTATASFYQRKPAKALSPASDIDELDATEAVFEPAGNFLKGEQSLRMQELRSHGFSQKFRDATVMKILTGIVTLVDIRTELEVKEADLIRWMGDLMARKQQTIDELKTTLLALQQKLPEPPRSVVDSAAAPRFADERSVVDGHVADR